MTVLNNNTKTEVFDNMTVKVVEVEWMVNEEEVVVVKSNCTFVKNVTVPLIQNVLIIFSSFLIESEGRRSKG